MSGFDLRSSQSSYGDPRHFSGASFGAPQPPPTKVLMDGYHGAPILKNVETPRYNPVSGSSTSCQVRHLLTPSLIHS